MRTSLTAVPAGHCACRFLDRATVSQWPVPGERNASRPRGVWAALSVRWAVPAVFRYTFTAVGRPHLESRADTSRTFRPKQSRSASNGVNGDREPVFHNLKRQLLATENLAGPVAHDKSYHLPRCSLLPFEQAAF